MGDSESSVLLSYAGLVLVPLPPWVLGRRLFSRCLWGFLESDPDRAVCLGFVSLRSVQYCAMWPLDALSPTLFLLCVISPFRRQHENGVNHPGRAAFLHEGSQCGREAEVAGRPGELQSLFDRHQDRKRKRWCQLSRRKWGCPLSGTRRKLAMWMIYIDHHHMVNHGKVSV